ncbi:MAG: hypothetical protein COA58_13295 [Bacteroidetes bacterium]|nr:MAG: hypothetical protein COA58_13295 [Bacteroidota bacterium]
MHSGIVISKPTSPLSHLQDLLRVNDKIEVSSSNWKTFAQHLEFKQPDIVFLDVDDLDQSEKVRCLELLKSHKINCVVVASDHESAYTAIKHGVLDYMVKPIKPDELDECIINVCSRFTKDNETSNTGSKKRFMINCLEGSYFFDYEEIIRCEAESNYTKIFCLNNTIIISKTLKSVCEKLPKNIFLRTHKSHLVNSNHIKRIKNGTSSFIVTSDGCEIPISRKNRSYIRQVLHAS